MIFSKNGRLKIVFRQSGVNLKGIADKSRQLARFSLAFSGTTSPKGMDAEGDSPRHGSQNEAKLRFGCLAGVSLAG